ncbi:hypothetical protein RFI_24311 [Reticulomyxa filosa]|uniref:Exportin-1/Importin-beta-like domain-containing protein n=1 Tax=Reticulomyxa filosa TaxID=46433 RepID=X6MGP8_RETFI|nr:hypothetical protein RFI_24311 [Reticulomyxa filosa]|eukprot:ETO13064.1 hypothetical protein RFI_24311 [Reticulomyxa filosa]
MQDSSLVQSVLKNNKKLEIISFSCNCIYEGILNEWKSISPESRMKLAQSLHNLVFQLSMYCFERYVRNEMREFAYVVNKLAGTIAFLALQANEGVSLMQTIIRHSIANEEWLEQKNSNPTDTTTSMQNVKEASELWCNLQVLNAFALELRQHHVDIKIIQDTSQKVAQEHRPTLLKILSVGIIAGRNTANVKLVQIALECLVQWRTILQLTFVRLSEFNVLNELLLLLKPLFALTPQSSSDGGGSRDRDSEKQRSRQHLVELLLECLKMNEPNDSLQKKYQQTLQTFSTALGAMQSILQEAIRAQQHEIIRSIAQLICGFAEAETKFIAEGAPSCLKIVQMILDCTSYPKTAISEMTFDFWMSLQDIAVANRHANLQQPVYSRLLTVLLAYPIDPEELSEYSRYRQVSADLFVCIFQLLQEDFMLCVSSQMKELFQKLSEPKTMTSEILTQIESCYFALSMIGQEISFTIEQNDSYKALVVKYIKPVCQSTFKSNLHQCYVQNINV